MTIKWGSASVFHLRNPLSIEHIDGLPKWKPPGKGKTSAGIVPIFKDEHAVPVNNSGGWFRLRFSGPKISTSEKTYRIDTRLAKAQKKGTVLTKDEIATIKDEEIEKLKKETPPTHMDVDVMYRDEWFLVCAGAASRCDLVTDFMLDKYPGLNFAVKTPEIEGDLTGLGLELFGAEGLEVDNVALGSGVKIKMQDDSVVEVSDSEYPKKLISTLKAAKEVMTMCVEWDRFGGKIRRDLSFTGIFDGFDPTEIEGEYDDPGERKFIEAKQRAEDFVTNIPLMLKDIAVHCGGLVPLEDTEDNVLPFERDAQ